MYDELLRALVDAVPGARGAVFCDSTGESVNAVGSSGRRAPGRRNDFDLRVAAAQLAPPVDRALQHLGALRELQVTGASETLLVNVLPEGYFVVLCLEPGALTARGWRQLRLAAGRLALEL
jgi:hypothetical protein